MQHAFMSSERAKASTIEWNRMQESFDGGVIGRVIKRQTQLLAYKLTHAGLFQCMIW